MSNMFKPGDRDYIDKLNALSSQFQQAVDASTEGVALDDGQVSLGSTWSSYKLNNMFAEQFSGSYNDLSDLPTEPLAHNHNETYYTKSEVADLAQPKTLVLDSVYDIVPSVDLDKGEVHPPKVDLGTLPENTNVYFTREETEITYKYTLGGITPVVSIVSSYSLFLDHPKPDPVTIVRPSVQFTSNQPVRGVYIKPIGSWHSTQPEDNIPIPSNPLPYDSTAGGQIARWAYSSRLTLYSNCNLAVDNVSGAPVESVTITGANLVIYWPNKETLSFIVRNMAGLIPPETPPFTMGVIPLKIPITALNEGYLALQGSSFNTPIGGTRLKSIIGGSWLIPFAFYNECAPREFVEASYSEFLDMFLPLDETDRQALADDWFGADEQVTPISDITMRYLAQQYGMSMFGKYPTGLVLLMLQGMGIPVEIGVEVTSIIEGSGSYELGIKTTIPILDNMETTTGKITYGTASSPLSPTHVLGLADMASDYDGFSFAPIPVNGQEVTTYHPVDLAPLLSLLND